MLSNIYSRPKRLKKISETSTGIHTVLTLNDEIGAQGRLFKQSTFKGGTYSAGAVIKFCSKQASVFHGG